MSLESVDSLLNALTDDGDDMKSEEEEKANNDGQTLSDSGDIECVLMYNKHSGKRQLVQMPGDSQEGKLDMAIIPVKHSVLDGRNAGITFGRNGFQLVNQQTSLATKDFYVNEDDIIRKVYYPEITKAVKEAVGAEFVIAIHHQVRSKSPPAYAKENVAPPAPAVHTDYTSRQAMEALKNLHMYPGVPANLDVSRYMSGRFAMINAWRNISDTNLIFNDHLAVCDGRTIIAPDDFICYDYISPEGNKSESYYLSHAHQSLHEWYYFPAMAKNELLLFMQYDSDYRAGARYTFHTAITDPNNSKLNPPFRESIEVRVIAFFPKHRPNTIPDSNAVQSTIEVVPHATASLMKAVSKESVGYWPKKMRVTFAQELRSKDIAEVISDMVTTSRILSGATDEVVQQVIDEMMKNKEEFKERALRNFPLVEEKNQ